MGRILVVRLGAMGDIIHALPAVSSLRNSFPHHSISWLVSPRWMPLLAGNPAIDHLVSFERHPFSQLRATFDRVREIKPDLAFDFQGLLQSALAGRLAGPKRFWGFTRNVARESLASFFYTDRVNAQGPHRVQRNLHLVEAAGATNITEAAWIPAGQAEGSLPDGHFVLASPFAGWTGKEWPIQQYAALAKLLRGEGLSLVLNVPASKLLALPSLPDVQVHTSSLSGLIYATRQALAVIGLDSGPLHLAAALRKPGVAIFGPTDPVATGPFGGTLAVLRAPDVESTYKRHNQVHVSMQAVSVEQVYSALLSSLQNSKEQFAKSGQQS